MSSARSSSAALASFVAEHRRSSRATRRSSSRSSRSSPRSASAARATAASAACVLVVVVVLGLRRRRPQRRRPTAPRRGSRPPCIARRGPAGRRRRLLPRPARPGRAAGCSTTARARAAHVPDGDRPSSSTGSTTRPEQRRRPGAFATRARPGRADHTVWYVAAPGYHNVTRASARRSRPCSGRIARHRPCSSCRTTRLFEFQGLIQYPARGATAALKRLRRRATCGPRSCRGWSPASSWSGRSASPASCSTRSAGQPRPSSSPRACSRGTRPSTATSRSTGTPRSRGRAALLPAVPAPRARLGDRPPRPPRCRAADHRERLRARVRRVAPPPALRETGDEALAGVRRGSASSSRRRWCSSWVTPRRRHVLAVGMFLLVRDRRCLGDPASRCSPGCAGPLGVLLVVPIAIEAMPAWRDGRRRNASSASAWCVSPVVGAGHLPAVGRARCTAICAAAHRPEPEPAARRVRRPVHAARGRVRDLFGGDRFGSGLHVLWVAVFLALLVVVFRRLPASYAATRRPLLVLSCRRGTSTRSSATR